MSKLSENTEYTGAVGALVTCEIDGKKYAILQKRAANDSFPGCLQVTVHGGLEGKNWRERESMLDGLMRETQEEIFEILNRSSLKDARGEDSGGLSYMAGKLDYYFHKGKILSVSRKTKHVKEPPINTSIRKTDLTLGYNLDHETVDFKLYFEPEIRQLVRDGVIVLLAADDINKLVPLNPKIHKEHGVIEEGKYGMFSDEIEAVKKVLLQQGTTLFK